MDCQDPPDNGAADMLTKEESAERLKTECNNLLSEIGLNTISSLPWFFTAYCCSSSSERLEMSRSTQNKRLKNIMNLVGIFCVRLVLVDVNMFINPCRLLALSTSRTVKPCRN
jgi:hypothetical protein